MVAQVCLALSAVCRVGLAFSVHGSDISILQGMKLIQTMSRSSSWEVAEAGFKLRAFLPLLPWRGTNDGCFWPDENSGKRQLVLGYIGPG